VKDVETENPPAVYLAPLRHALIADNRQHVNVVVCEGDYRALKKGKHLMPAGAVAERPTREELSQ
jgi:hypothetical protein